MNKERTILRSEKARYKEQLASLRNYLKELKSQCDHCGTAHEHVSPALLKAEHDAQFYESRIKDVKARLRAIAASAKAASTNN